jgi:hypothetical protein
LNNDVSNEIQLMKSNFDIQIIVNKEGWWHEEND